MPMVILRHLFQRKKKSNMNIFNIPFNMRRKRSMNIFLLLICSFLMSACSISLFPPYTPSAKYTVPAPLLSDSNMVLCENDVPPSIYFHGLEVFAPFGGIKVLFHDKATSEIKQIAGAKWAAAFESLFSSAFERGMREFFLESKVTILSRDSSLGSDYEIGVSLVEISIGSIPIGDTEKKDATLGIHLDLIVRILDTLSARESYHSLKSFRELEQGDFQENGVLTSDVFIQNLQALLSEASIKTYQVIDQNICGEVDKTKNKLCSL